MTYDLRPPSIVIAAAGRGREMRGGPPPILVDLGRETVLARHLRILGKAFPGSDITVVAGCQAGRVVDQVPPGVKVAENPAYATTCSARSLGMGIRVADSRKVILVHGDLVYDEKAVRHLTKAGSCVLVDRSGQIRDREVGVTVADGRATRFDYDLDAKWGQIAYLEGACTEAFLATATLGSPRLTFEALNVATTAGRIRAIEPRGVFLCEIDTASDIDRARTAP